MKFSYIYCMILVSFVQNYVVNGQNYQNHHHRGVNRTTNYNGITRNDGYDRVFDKLTNLATLDEEQMKKLDALEHKLIKLEATNTERLDLVRADLKNLDWVTTKSDGTLERLRADIEAMSHSKDISDHVVRERKDIPTAKEPVNEIEISDKLLSIATLLLSTRNAVSSAEATLNHIAMNITNLLKVSREIHQRQFILPTKQYLSSALHGIKTQHQIYGILPSQNPSNSLDEISSSDPISCSHINQIGDVKSGIQKIQIKSLQGIESFYVWCDMDIVDGGWTVIQNRQDGSINFNRNWLEYKLGFGNIAGEFFIGLDKLHAITNHMVHELLIVMEDFNGTSKYARYNLFAIGGDKEDYALNVLGSYKGTAGDSLSYSAAHKFSTFDNDNDGWIEGNCAQAHTGAWWYNACEMANLNGKYFGGNVDVTNLFQGMYWNDFHGPGYSLKSVKMLIRPIDRIFNPDMI